MRRTRLLTLCLTLLCLSGAGIAVMQTDDDTGPAELDRARRAFERHNYRAALEMLEQAPPDATGAALLRARCLLRLQRWDDGVPVLERLLAEHAELDRRPELHEELGDADLERHGAGRLAVVHLGRAAELYVENHDRPAAAAALIRQADAYMRLRDLRGLPGITGDEPDDWRECRRFQKQHALRALKRAVELGGDSEHALEATFRMGRLHQRERLHLQRDEDGNDLDQALAAYTRVVEGWPESARAPEALYEIGQIHQHYRDDYVTAVRYYRRVVDEYARSSWARRAARQAEEITAPRLGLGVGGPVPPGTRPEIHFQCRNVPAISLRAYRVELFDFIREVGFLNRLEKWQPRQEPVASWAVAVPDEGKHRHFGSGADGLHPTALPVSEPGAYVILAEGAGGKARAEAVAIISRLSCLTKSARSATLFWVADAESGEPAGGAEVLVQGPAVKGRFAYYQTGRTDDAGLFRFVHTDRKDRSHGEAKTLLVRDGDHYAVCGSNYHWYWWGFRGPYRAYTFTDRPVYRPDQVIHFKTILRMYEQGAYETAAHRAVAVEVRDPQGEVVDRRELHTGAEGSASGDLRLPDDTALGLYRIRMTVDGRPVDAGQGARFRIEEYRKPEYEVTVAAGRPDCRVGESVEARITARYYFGEPVAGARVVARVFRSPQYPHFRRPGPWPWFFEDFGPHERRGPGGDFGRSGDLRRRHTRRDLVGTYELTTDDQGVAIVGLETEPWPSAPDADLRYDVEAEVTDKSLRVITASGSIKVTHQPFHIQVRPQHAIHQPGDTVRLEIESQGPNGDPVAFRGECKVYRLTRRVSGDEDTGNERVEYDLGDKVFEERIEAGSNGRGEVKWVTDEEGPFRVVVASFTDPAVTGKCDLWVTQRGGRYAHYAYRDVELVLDRASYVPGDTARVLINTRFDRCYVLFTMEGDDLYSHRIVFVHGGTGMLELPITARHVPNVRLAAAVLRDQKVFLDEIELVVPPAERFLTVTLETPGREFYPHQQVSVEVASADSAGEPAPAELALMMVDASIYYIQPELRQRIERFFYGRERPHLVRTDTNFDFRSGDSPMANERVFSGGEDGAAGAPRMAKAMEMAPADGKKAGGEYAVAEIRREFPDTVLWAAHVMTDQAGRASVPVTLPDTLTTWRIHAIAIDRDTRIGQTATDVVTRKDIIARLEAPRFLVEGDDPVLTVIAHNYLDEAKRVRVRLEGSEAVRIDTPTLHGEPIPDAAPGEAEIVVPAASEVAVDFPARALLPGTGRLTAGVAADVDADALEITLPVLTYGADRFVASSGAIRQGDAEQSATVAMRVPGEVAPDSPLMEVHLSPSLAAVMIDALPYLLEYPYGCTEQTVSRFIPAVVTRRTLQHLGIDLAAVQRKIEAQGGPGDGGPPRWRRTSPVFNNAVMDDMIRSGLKRLEDLQGADGGWGWWGGGASNPYMTAYVVYGLTEARDADLAFDRTVLLRGVDFLLQRVTGTEPAARHWWGRDDLNVRTWMLYALARYDAALLARENVRAMLDRIYEQRDALTDYSRGMLLITLHRVGEAERAGILIENLYNTVVLDEKAGTASWGHGDRYRYWYDSGVESTAMILRALLLVRPDHAYVSGAVNWLVRNRRGTRWHNTKDTAMAVYALAEYLAVSGELSADMRVGVTIDERIRRSFRVTPDNALTFDARLLIAPENLGPGEHRVRLDREGSGNLYYGVYLDYFTRQDPIPPAGNEVHIRRSYHRLVAREVTRTRSAYDREEGKTVQESYQALEYERIPLAEGEVVRSGELVEVSLELTADNDLEYLIVEDPKPAGCEPTALLSGFGRAGDLFGHRELRDTKSAFFTTRLPQGRHELSYRLRCERPGRFAALPARAEAMYSPLVRANSRSDRMEIHPRNDASGD